MVGNHTIRCWSSTQKTIALSSAEAELTALVKASCEAVGLAQMAQEWGIQLEAEVMVDSSAAIGVVNRKGNGKLRHVRIGQLWVQEKRKLDEIRYTKVDGNQNPADLMTKGLGRSDREFYLEKMHIEV